MTNDLDSPFKQSAESWHAQAAGAVVDRLRTGEARGLTGKEAERRLAEYGLNRLPEPKRRGPLVRLLLQFHNPLIYVLLVASVVTFLLDYYADAAVILSVVIINALIGFVQEGKA
ncbi:cation-transporting P-type ATPase, partial [Thiocapsa sp.]|uniref:cation-transporting P-type ATPase n=1 Tax=Thiocapsa sp. TaxID=2024551 RepID=UPI0025F94295